MGALFVVALILAACGGQVQQAVEEVAPTLEAAAEEIAPTVEAAVEEIAPTVEAAVEEAAAGEAITLRWRTRPDNQAEIDVYQSVSDSIEIPGVELVYEPGGSETSSYQDVLKTELAAGTAPDVFWIPGTDVADFVQRGLLLDLRDLAGATEGYSDDDFYPGPMFHLTFDPETSENGGVLRAARDAGLVVPDELSVIRVDDIPLAAYFEPPLTTVRQDFAAIGQQAARLLVRAVQDPKAPHEHLLLPGEMIIRSSTALSEKAGRAAPASQMSPQAMG